MIDTIKKAFFILLASLLTTSVSLSCSNDNNTYLSSEYSDTGSHSDSELDNDMTSMYAFERNTQILIPFPIPVYATQQNPIHVLEGAGIELPEATLAPAAALMNQNQKHKQIKKVAGTQTGLVEKQKIARIICRPQAKSQDKEQCPTCNNYYSNLSMHMLIHKLQNPDLTCHTCGHVAVDASRLRIHEKIHTGHTFFCPQCPDKTFSTLTNLNRHNREKHAEQELIPCIQCGYEFKRLSDKNRHERQVHGITHQ